MNVFKSAKKSILRPLKGIFFLLVFLFVVALSGNLAACKKSLDYFSYVSELRSNIFLAETEGFSLRVYAVEKEYPYAMDGVKRDVSARTEIYLCAPSGTQDCSLAFTVNGTEQGGEMSFDNVRAEYYYSCTLDVSALTVLEMQITYGKETFTLAAQSVLAEDTLAPKTVLDGLVTAEKALFEGMTDDYGFAGEIYLRLIYEDSPYYYVGVISRDGKSHAFLINAKTGKILAKRQN